VTGVSLSHRAEFAGYRGLSSAFSFLPFSAQRALALGLGWFGGSVVRVRRAVVDENLLRAFPAESPSWRNEVARASYRHLVRETLAMTRFTRLGPGAVRAAVRWDAQEEIRDLISGGEGVIFVSGHLGNWELGGARLASSGLPVAAVTARQSNPLFNRHVEASRRHFGTEVIFRSEGFGPLTVALRKGKLMAIVADQNAQAGHTFVDFLGVPAATAKGPAVLALRTGAPLFLALCIREPGPRDRYWVTTERVPVEKGDSAHTLVQRYTSMFDGWVRRYPDQYFWHHRRWKTRPPDEIQGIAPGG
jgi:KDO2-lipid IV(A) lauroyltransferase